MNQAASKKALGAYIEMSDWALESSGMDTSRPVLALRLPLALPKGARAPGAALQNGAA